MGNYASFKNTLSNMVAEYFNGYVNLNFLPIELYKDEACIQVFSGGDPVGPGITAYTKFRLIDIMDGSGNNDPPGTVGHITGTVNLANRNPYWQIYINAYYPSGNLVDDGQGGYTVKSDSSFSIPFTQGFYDALQLGTQDLYFILWVNSSANSGYYKDTGSSIQVTSGDLSSGNLNVGSLGTTVDINSITLSGTITVTYNGEPVPRIVIAAYNSSPQPVCYATLTSPGTNTAWTTIMPPFDSPTPLSIKVIGYDSSGNQLFAEDTGVTASAHNVDATVPPITLNITG
jgi:hypothetical protein